jgi:glyoxylase-like metal-dependent hydrolase (beta-lactamase superfamily II)
MTPATAPAAPAFHVGEFVCHAVPDGELAYPRAAVFGPDADPVAVNRFPEEFAAPYTPLLVNTGAHRVLLDTGAGPLAPTTGRLQANLALAGCRPEDIDLVVLSHAHADHIGGLVTEDGAPAFPNARIPMSRCEYDFWHSAELRQRLGSGSVYGNAAIENAIAA